MTIKKQHYTFRKKRNYKLITPCCNSSNKDGKFINYNELPDGYGYCHSCGKPTIPPKIYLDNVGNEHIWNNLLNTYKNNTLPTNQRIPPTNQPTGHSNKPQINFIPESILWNNYLSNPENNLLLYLRTIYSNDKVDLAKYMYAIGTTKDGGTIFWQINKNLKIQKSKISYYSTNGKRTNKFKVPYKNDDGYYSCLFGEHLILDKLKGTDTIILVESEKTALVGFINLPQYTWLSYGGLTQLTDNKINALIGHKVLIIPDISNKAVKVIKEKLPRLSELGVNASLWDMTNGKSDIELKLGGIYNDDLEDYFRKIKNLPT